MSLVRPSLPDDSEVGSLGCACGRYGHVAKLAQKEKEGVDSIDGAEGVLFQVRRLSLPFAHTPCLTAYSNWA